MTNSITDFLGDSVDARFRNLIDSIPQEYLKIQGISVLSALDLSNNYFNSDTVAHMSIDPNANVGNKKSPVSFQSEIFKPQLKLLGYYELWKRLKDKYDLETANDCIKSCLIGELYFHDITKINVPYCFAFDTSYIMTQGRPYGWLTSCAPNRSNSFIAQVIETTMDMSQEHAGAVAIANVLVNLSYYTRRERKQLREAIESIWEDSDRSMGLRIQDSIDAIIVYFSGLGFNVKSIDKRILENTGKETISSFSDALEMANIVYDKYIENILQNLVHILHNTFRIGGDSPFTNASVFDSETFKTVFADALYPDYTPVVENWEEVKRIQKVFIDFFAVGSPITHKPYRFPVVTANCKLSKDGKIADEEFYDYICKKNRILGAFNIHVGEKIASCCRLTNDLAKLKNTVRTDSFGNGGLSIGSHRVVAVNLHRVALKAKYEGTTYRDMLVEELEKAEKLLIVHKELLAERIKGGFLKFFNIGWEDMSMFFSTIGFTGLIDAYSVITGKNINEIVADEDYLNTYVEFASGVINTMELFTDKAGREIPNSAWNVEEIPAENASPKLASADNYTYRGYSDYEPRPLLSNQMIPLYTDVLFMTRLKISGRLMNEVSGGSVLHINITEQVTEGAYLELCKAIIEQYKVPHFAVNVGTTTCENGHTVPGIYRDTCPECGAKAVDWVMRVVGFQTDVSSWSKERQNEFKNRQMYTAQDIL